MTVQKTKLIYMTIKTAQNTQVIISRFHLSILHLQQNISNSYLMNHLVKWKSYVIWHLLEFLHHTDLLKTYMKHL